MISQLVRYRISNQFASKHHLTLQEQDSEIFNLIKQCEKSHLIDFVQTPTSVAVKECLSSMLSAKYASGFPGKKNKPGTEIYEEIEKICWQRALDGFGLDKTNFQVNAQLQSVQAAKFIVSKAMVQPGGTILCLGNIDTQCLRKYYKVIEEDKKEEKIDLVIDARLTNLDSLWKEYQHTSTPILLDITEKAPFFVTNILENEHKFLENYHFITLRTESLLGPKGCILFSNRKYQELIEEGCYPGYQSGPHFHTLTGLAVALQELKNDSYKDFFQQVKANCSSLKRQLKLKQFPLIDTFGTNVSISGSFEELKMLEEAGILASYGENRIDFNMTPITYEGIKQDSIPLLSNILGLALYKSEHGKFLSDPNNLGWKHELELAKQEFFNYF